MLANIEHKIYPMTEDNIDKVRQVESQMLEKEQVDLPTLHTIHGGLYTRTVLLKKGHALCGALIKVPTTLILNGNVMVYIGTEFTHIVGYDVIPASANRKQLMIAIEDTYITMCLKTEYRKLEYIEKEFTDEYDMLMSSSDTAINTIIIGD